MKDKWFIGFMTGWAMTFTAERVCDLANHLLSEPTETKYVPIYPCTNYKSTDSTAVFNSAGAVQDKMAGEKANNRREKSYTAFISN